MDIEYTISCYEFMDATLPALIQRVRAGLILLGKQKMRDILDVDLDKYTRYEEGLKESIKLAACAFADESQRTGGYCEEHLAALSILQKL